jgi:EAL domain-containing protein (putative c-di-GMP-specific phosphodiesterase class I)
MDSVAQPVILGSKEFFVTCSIGVALYPNDSAAADSLLEHADIAMYRAKKVGRNNFQFYSPAMNEEAMERVRIESALRNALARDEFVLHYQPQVNLESGQIVGMEALIRWQHPELGMVAPNRFISVAEETGLIVPIGAWVMRTACAQTKAWQDAGLGQLRVAVNLSARQFGAANLLADIAAVLEHTGLAPDRLEIELTESLFMSDVTLAVELLHAMKKLGVSLSIDDFGTGYSSLSYLSRFPIDVLKIDRSFVADITRDASDAAIVASIIALAHNLKLDVIAEGVETREQLEYLRRHGCDQMQGYYFSRPLAAANFEQLLREHLEARMGTEAV